MKTNILIFDDFLSSITKRFPFLFNGKLADASVISEFKKVTIKEEGGLSNSKLDWAAKNPANANETGYHTNKGVTWSTYRSKAEKLGLDPSPRAFVSMTDDQWGKIWNSVARSTGLSDIQNQFPRSYCCASRFTWGGGQTPALLKQFNRVFSDVNLSFKNSKDISDFIMNADPKVDGLIAWMIMDMRLSYLNGLGANWRTNGRTWVRRSENELTSITNISPRYSQEKKDSFTRLSSQYYNIISKNLAVSVNGSNIEQSKALLILDQEPEDAEDLMNIIEPFSTSRQVDSLFIFKPSQ
jgi:hypothetical protein